MVRGLQKVRTKRKKCARRPAGACADHKKSARKGKSPHGAQKSPHGREKRPHGWLVLTGDCEGFHPAAVIETSHGIIVAKPVRMPHLIACIEEALGRQLPSA